MRICHTFYFLILLSLTSCMVLKKKTGHVSLYKSHPLAILQGATDSDETYIGVVFEDKLSSLEYFYGPVDDSELIDLEPVDNEPEPKSLKVPKLSGLNKLEVFKAHTSPDLKKQIHHIHIKNLKINQLYKFVVKSKNKIIDERTFKVLDSKKLRPRIGLVSCMDDRFTDEAMKMWSSYLNKFTDLNFFIGDNVYATVGLLDVSKNFHSHLWNRYFETFKRLYFYHSSSLTPVFALWDDHDYGKQDGGVAFKEKDKALSVFNAFFPRYEVEHFKTTSFGAGSVLEAYGQKFLFLDGRYYRDVEHSKGQHLGEAQFDFVLKSLAKNKKTPLWLIKGDQFFGGYHPFESFERQHPEQFKKLTKAVEKRKAPVMFISGDRHLSEITSVGSKEFGFKSFEITSSAIHAKVYKDSFKKHPNPRQLVGKDGVYNYSVLEIMSKRRYKVRSFGEKDWTHYTRELNL